ncbi:MAG TPA: shikimate dehydrogenase [Deltaproteobacteria bacterium]|nr:shikimate dehydrogenase [Deltaproteobacteria bacterium]HQI02270.1 shikimate dehydrogenase [Deltaproteobacteria bacterium]
MKNTPRVKITGNTRVLTILAHPAINVTAPMVFNHIFKAADLDMVYIPHDVLPLGVKETISAYRQWNNLSGFNVTIPHKESVAKLVDRSVPPADRLGAVNTVVRSPEGSLIGYNTDGTGALRALGDVKGSHCLIIGAGGAARAIIDSLVEAGAEHIFLLNRTPENANSLMELFPRGRISLFSQASLSEIDIVVQATPLTNHVPFDLDIELLRKGAKVLETVMRETAFSREVLRYGLELIPGHAMLYHQTKTNFELLSGIEVPDDIIKDAFRSLGYIAP